MTVTTYPVAFGSLNSQLDINVTSISYSGANTDLQTLVDGQPALLDVSFQFGSSETLTQLSTGAGPTTTSYNGGLTVEGGGAVPEPSTVVLSVLGALSLFYFRRLRK